MIIRIFKISTKTMAIVRNKNGLRKYIYDEIGVNLPKDYTITQMINYLPVGNYFRIK